MLIDAHCHLDAAAFAHDQSHVIQRAKAVGVTHFVVPSTTRDSWAQVLALGKRADVSACIGLHPYFITQHHAADLEALETVAASQLALGNLVAIGECGIDARFADTLALQWSYFDSQLILAKKLELPVVIHCVKANDPVSSKLRRLALPRGGLVHAFAGSMAQAKAFVKLGYVLGIGGAVTYPRAQRFRRVVAELPDNSYVLETDSPEMPLKGGQGQRNEPAHIVDICHTVAALRGQTVEQVAYQSSANAQRLFALSI